MGDLVLYGATGFVGVLVARYLKEKGVETTLAGRSREKLDAVRAALGVDWPVAVADASDAEALGALAASARTVITTAGPYVKYGRALAHACAAAGTHYADLTGEVLFVRESIDTNHDLAKQTGARVVHSCGYDSIPSDLGVHVLNQRVKDDGEGDLTDTTLVVSSVRGGISGGTIDSMRTQLDAMRKDKALRRIAMSPYSLSPDHAAEPDLGRQRDTISAGRLAPFVMAPYNTRIVRRSNALRGYAYGRRFRYREAIRMRNSLSALGMEAGLGALVVGMTLPPTRFVLDRVLPKPGTGPSEEVRRTGHFTMDIFTTTSTGARYTARVKAKGDPGYAATAVMLSESGLALLADGEELPALGGGVLTPATGIGDALVTRLRAAGFEISAHRVG